MKRLDPEGDVGGIIDLRIFKHLSDNVITFNYAHRSVCAEAFELVSDIDDRIAGWERTDR